MDSRGSYNGPPSPSSFDIGTNTTYEYNYSYTITKKTILSSQLEIWIPSISNRTILTESGLYQQEFTIQSIQSDSAIESNIIKDEYGNLIYYYKFLLSGHSSWHFSLSGNLTLREVHWSPNSSILMSDYNTSDPLYIRYTSEEKYINKSHPLIAGNATLLKSNEVFKTVDHVYNFVVSYLDYRVLDSENGAEFAIENSYGDCTEFSYLMVALLRASGIPARVLRGIVIATMDATTGLATPQFNASVGSTWNFDTIYDSGNVVVNNITGHAWAEYFVPGYGWILADPTWGNALNYSSDIDNIHVPYTVGVWIGKGIDPPLPSDYNPTNLFSTNPFPITNDPAYRHEIHRRFTVIVQELAEQPGTGMDLMTLVLNYGIYIISGVGVSLLLLILLVIASRSNKKRHKKKENQKYRVFFDDY
ncbi:MAG: transglutaminase-like domain-containing protein [Promethearchaeota archaeon]